MLDYETQRKLIVVFILATILVLIGTIVALVYIWTPKTEVNQEEVYEVGKVNKPVVTEEDVIKKYYEQLFVMFVNNDIDAIYNLVGEDYLKYNKYDKEDIVEYLRQKSVMSRGLELVQYQSFWILGYSNVYSLNLKAKDEAYAINIIIREKSPNNYTIAFDNFIDYKENTDESIINSVHFNVEKRIRYTNSVQYEFRLVNRYNGNIVINSGSTGNPIILVNSQSESRRAVLTSLSTAEYTLKPGDFTSCTAVFNIEKDVDYMSYKTLVLKNIAYEGIAGTTNLEFKLN